MLKFIFPGDKIIFYYILAMRLALGAERHMLKFVEPYWKRDVMV